MFPPEEAAAPQSGSPEVLEEDEAELELQKQLEKGRRLRQLQQLRDSGEKVRAAAGRPGRVCAGLPGAFGTGASLVTCPPSVAPAFQSGSSFLFNVVLLVDLFKFKQYFCSKIF